MGHEAAIEAWAKGRRAAELNVRHRRESHLLLRNAAEAMLKKYVALVESGDAGSWDALSDNEVSDLGFAIHEYDRLHGFDGEATP